MPLVCNNTVVVKGEVVVRKTVGITGKFLDELGATPTFFFLGFWGKLTFAFFLYGASWQVERTWLDKWQRVWWLDLVLSSSSMQHSQDLVLESKTCQDSWKKPCLKMEWLYELIWRRLFHFSCMLSHRKPTWKSAGKSPLHPCGTTRLEARPGGNLTGDDKSEAVWPWPSVISWAAWQEGQLGKRSSLARDVRMNL